MTYSYSTDEERFEGECASREEAIAEAQAEYEWPDVEGRRLTTVCTGRNVRRTAGEYVGGMGEAVAERMVEDACDLVGDDLADDWLREVLPAWGDRTVEVRERADALLRDLDAHIVAVVEAWATEHGLQPDFWHVVDVQRHDLTDAGAAIAKATAEATDD